MNKTITVRIVGGLGNQLFCYSFGRALALKHSNKLRFDTQSGYFFDKYNRQFLLNYFPNCKINEKRNTNIFLSKPKHKILKFINYILPEKLKFYFIEERPIRYQKELFQKKIFFSKYFIGNWANCMYFNEISNELRKELIPPSPKSIEVIKLLKKIKDVNSCFIHWRSYEEESCVAHPTMDEYYIQAIKYIINRHEDIYFFVFSDIPSLAIKKFAHFGNLSFFNLHESQGNLQSLNDFYLMYNCNHAIIGDSTFSWWAAWLSNQKNKTVIAPRGLSPWGDQSIPENWVSINAL